jgi:hypothetical protein
VAEAAESAKLEARRTVSDIARSRLLHHSMCEIQAELVESILGFNDAACVINTQTSALHDGFTQELNAALADLRDAVLDAKGWEWLENETALEADELYHVDELLRGNASPDLDYFVATREQLRNELKGSAGDFPLTSLSEELDHLGMMKQLDKDHQWGFSSLLELRQQLQECLKTAAAETRNDDWNAILAAQKAATTPKAWDDKLAAFEELKRKEIKSATLPPLQPKELTAQLSEAHKLLLGDIKELGKAHDEIDRSCKKSMSKLGAAFGTNLGTSANEKLSAYAKAVRNLANSAKPKLAEHASACTTCPQFARIFLQYWIAHGSKEPAAELAGSETDPGSKLTETEGKAAFEALVELDRSIAAQLRFDIEPLAEPNDVVKSMDNKQFNINGHVHTFGLLISAFEPADLEFSVAPPIVLEPEAWHQKAATGDDAELYALGEPQDSARKAWDGEGTLCETGFEKEMLRAVYNGAGIRLETVNEMLRGLQDGGSVFGEGKPGEARFAESAGFFKSKGPEAQLVRDLNDACASLKSALNGFGDCYRKTAKVSSAASEAFLKGIASLEKAARTSVESERKNFCVLAQQVHVMRDICVGISTRKQHGRAIASFWTSFCEQNKRPVDDLTSRHHLATGPGVTTAIGAVMANCARFDGGVDSAIDPDIGALLELESMLVSLRGSSGMTSISAIPRLLAPPMTTAELRQSTGLLDVSVDSSAAMRNVFSDTRMANLGKEVSMVAVGAGPFEKAADQFCDELDARFTEIKAEAKGLWGQLCKDMPEGFVIIPDVEVLAPPRLWPKLDVIAKGAVGFAPNVPKQSERYYGLIKVRVTLNKRADILQREHTATIQIAKARDLMPTHTSTVLSNFAQKTAHPLIKVKVATTQASGIMLENTLHPDWTKRNHKSKPIFPEDSTHTFEFMESASSEETLARIHTVSQGKTDALPCVTGQVELDLGELIKLRDSGVKVTDAHGSEFEVVEQVQRAFAHIDPAYSAQDARADADAVTAQLKSIEQRLKANLAFQKGEFDRVRKRFVKAQDEALEKLPIRARAVMETPQFARLWLNYWAAIGSKEATSAAARKQESMNGRPESGLSEDEPDGVASLRSPGVDPGQCISEEEGKRVFLELVELDNSVAGQLRFDIEPLADMTSALKEAATVARSRKFPVQKGNFHSLKVAYTPKPITFEVAPPVVLDSNAWPGSADQTETFAVGEPQDWVRRGKGVLCETRYDKDEVRGIYNGAAEKLKEVYELMRGFQDGNSVFGAKQPGEAQFREGAWGQALRKSKGPDAELIKDLNASWSALKGSLNGFCDRRRKLEKEIGYMEKETKVIMEEAEQPYEESRGVQNDVEILADVQIIKQEYATRLEGIVTEVARALNTGQRQSALAKLHKAMFQQAFRFLNEQHSHFEAWLPIRKSVPKLGKCHLQKRHWDGDAQKEVAGAVRDQLEFCAQRLNGHKLHSAYTPGISKLLSKTSKAILKQLEEVGEKQRKFVEECRDSLLETKEVCTAEKMRFTDFFTDFWDDHQALFNVAVQRTAVTRALEKATKKVTDASKNKVKNYQKYSTAIVELAELEAQNEGMEKNISAMDGQMRTEVMALFSFLSQIDSVIDGELVLPLKMHGRLHKAMLIHDDDIVLPEIPQITRAPSRQPAGFQAALDDAADRVALPPCVFTKISTAIALAVQSTSADLQAALQGAGGAGGGQPETQLVGILENAKPEEFTGNLGSAFAQGSTSRERLVAECVEMVLSGYPHLHYNAKQLEEFYCGDASQQGYCMAGRLIVQPTAKSVKGGGDSGSGGAVAVPVPTAVLADFETVKAILLMTSSDGGMAQKIEQAFLVLLAGIQKAHNEEVDLTHPSSVDEIKGVLLPTPIDLCLQLFTELPPVVRLLAIACNQFAMTGSVDDFGPAVIECIKPKLASALKLHPIFGTSIIAFISGNFAPVLPHATDIIVSLLRGLQFQQSDLALLTTHLQRGSNAEAIVRLALPLIHGEVTEMVVVQIMVAVQVPDASIYAMLSRAAIPKLSSRLQDLGVQGDDHSMCLRLLKHQLEGAGGKEAGLSESAFYRTIDPVLHGEPTQIAILGVLMVAGIAEEPARAMLVRCEKAFVLDKLAAVGFEAQCVTAVDTQLTEIIASLETTGARGGDKIHAFMVAAQSLQKQLTLAALLDVLRAVNIEEHNARSMVVRAVQAVVSKSLAVIGICQGNEVEKVTTKIPVLLTSKSKSKMVAAFPEIASLMSGDITKSIFSRVLKSFGMKKEEAEALLAPVSWDAVPSTPPVQHGLWPKGMQSSGLVHEIDSQDLPAAVVKLTKAAMSGNSSLALSASADLVCEALSAQEIPLEMVTLVRAGLNYDKEALANAAVGYLSSCDSLSPAQQDLIDKAVVARDIAQRMLRAGQDMLVLGGQLQCVLLVEALGTIGMLQENIQDIVKAAHGDLSAQPEPGEDSGAASKSRGFSLGKQAAAGAAAPLTSEGREKAAMAQCRALLDGFLAPVLKEHVKAKQFLESVTSDEALITINEIHQLKRRGESRRLVLEIGKFCLAILPVQEVIKQIEAVFGRELAEAAHIMLQTFNFTNTPQAVTEPPPKSLEALLAWTSRMGTELRSLLSAFVRRNLNSAVKITLQLVANVKASALAFRDLRKDGALSTLNIGMGSPLTKSAVKPLGPLFKRLFEQLHSKDNSAVARTIVEVGIAAGKGLKATTAAVLTLFCEVTAKLMEMFAAVQTGAPEFKSLLGMSKSIVQRTDPRVYQDALADFFAPEDSGAEGDSQEESVAAVLKKSTGVAINSLIVAKDMANVVKFSAKSLFMDGEMIDNKQHHDNLASHPCLRLVLSPSHPPHPLCPLAHPPPTLPPVFLLCVCMCTFCIAITAFQNAVGVITKQAPRMMKHVLTTISDMAHKILPSSLYKRLKILLDNSGLAISAYKARAAKQWANMGKFLAELSVKLVPTGRNIQHKFSVLTVC